MLEDADLPHYRLTKPRPRPVIERWLPVIEAWLREDEAPGVPKKQRHTSARIHERLTEEYPGEFNTAESTNWGTCRLHKADHYCFSSVLTAMKKEAYSLLRILSSLAGPMSSTMPLTTALLDRLTHRSHILVFEGESYRFREASVVMQPLEH